MNDAECVTFLQWALPRLQMRWKGFRRVRRQVRRRIAARLAALDLQDADAYRGYLAGQPDEWAVLDRLCRVTISRFHRNRGVFRLLFATVLPQVLERAAARGEDTLRVWSIGCASGEEPYTLAIGWEHGLPSAAPVLHLRIVATDADAHMLERARKAEYAWSSVRELPASWLDTAFERSDAGTYRLRGAYRRDVELRCEDVRQRMPRGPFDVVLCRNLVFTYFAEALQRRVLDGIAARLVEGGALVLGPHEVLPAGASGFVVWDGERSVLRHQPRTAREAAGT